jgi:hypothetical protein
MAVVLDKSDAIKIAKKLCAELVEKTRHQIAKVYVNGACVAIFGIRRGSRRGRQGHNHIARQIFVSMRQAKDLAECPMSREDWINLLIGLGVIANADEIKPGGIGVAYQGDS